MTRHSHTAVIPGLGRLGQEDHKFKANLGYMKSFRLDCAVKERVSEEKRKVIVNKLRGFKITEWLRLFHRVEGTGETGLFFLSSSNFGLIRRFLYIIPKHTHTHHFFLPTR